MNVSNVEEYIIEKFIKDHPYIHLKHIYKLTNDTGIIQHAKFNLPNYHHGYCLDDNSRGLLLICNCSNEDLLEGLDQLLATYLSYIYYMQKDDGNFINFMSYNLTFLENKGSDDSFGRTIWAIGELIAKSEWSAYHAIAFEILNKAIRQIHELTSLRAKGYAILGILAILTHYPERQDLREILIKLKDANFQELTIAKKDNWYWYESILTYDNAILPLSLLRASHYLQDEVSFKEALRTFHFLDQLCFQQEYLQPIGNEKWYTHGGEFSKYGQQPIEIPMMMLLYQEMGKHQNFQEMSKKLQKSFLWFLGLNSKGLPLFNEDTKGCFDGLESYGVNQNQGAESTLSFWFAYLILKSAQAL